MGRLALIRAIAAALSVAAACGGSAFTTGGEGDDGGGTSGDATPDLTTSDTGGGPDAPAVDGGHADATGGPDAIALPDVLSEAPPACSGAYACVPAVPSGWAGPLEVYAGPGPVPACSPLFQLSQDGNDQLDAGQPDCGCQCGNPKVTCGSLPVSFFSQVGCSSVTACSSTTLAPFTCTPEDVGTLCKVSPVTYYMSAPQAAVTGASCAPQGTQSVPPLGWGLVGRACASTVAAQQVDCPAGAVCAPRPAPPFSAAACIASVGDVPCPAQGYTARHVFFTGANDTRGCTACTCGDAGGPACTATVNVYPQGQSCTGQPVSYQAPFACVAVDTPRDFEVQTTFASGGCPPSHSVPTGGAATTGPVTVCCTQ